MKKRSAILPTLAIPALAMSMVSCEIGKDVTAETASIDDKKQIAATEDEKAIQKQLGDAEKSRTNAEKAIENATRDLADVNARIADLETKLAELQTQGVTLGSHKSPGGGAAPSTTTPAPTPVAPAPTTTNDATPTTAEATASAAEATTTTSSTEATPPTPTPEATTPPVASNEGDGATAGEMMDLKTEFPIPMFIGTPVPVKLSNLEPPGKPKLTMPVPVGTKNVAAGKPVTSSDPEPTIGDLEFVTDGDKDGGDGFFVELGFDTQWVQIDLEKEYNNHAIVVWHFHKAACAYYDVIVQISNDPEFKEGVVTVFNSDDDNSSGFGVGRDPAYIETNHGRIIDAKGTKGRYVRLYSNGNTANDLNHYIEVEVHATE